MGEFCIVSLVKLVCLIAYIKHANAVWCCCNKKTKISVYCLRLPLFRTYVKNTCTAMYHLENYYVRSAVYKIHAKHTLKLSRSHMWAVAHCLAI